MAMAQESVADLSVNDFYFSAHFYEKSDVKYAKELQLQEVLMADTITSQMSKGCSSAPSLLIIQAILPEPEATEIEEKSGESSLSFCDICAERKEHGQMYNVEGCIHSFCSDCISKHMETKIMDNVITVNCPGLNCKSVLDFHAYKHVIAKKVLEIWEQALCEALIAPPKRFYCPFEDCSAMMVNENGGGEEIMRESECPFCHRLFCALCHVPWHSGVECEEFQRLNADERGREDLMVRELAKEQKWSRCPQCKFYVERTGGCPHMTCRCNFQFCYGCQSEWTANHGGCCRQ